MQNSAFRFYLSSTFKDLSGQRQKIRDFLVDNENLPVETVSASADPVLEQCLRDVESCDAMILLVANSYGTVIDAPDGKRRSITHCEFIHARTRKKPLPVLAFFLDYVEPSEEQTEEQKNGLRGLQGELSNLQLIPARVSEAESLGFKVATAVVNQLKKFTEAPFTGSDRDNSAFEIPMKTAAAQRLVPSTGSTEIYLQVQVKPKGKRADNFLLSPEVFVRSSNPDAGPWQALPEADPEPVENVQAADLAAQLRELGDQAEQGVFASGWTGFDRLVMELLLPTELLVECLGHESAAEALRQALRDLDRPYLVRSLDRAEACKRAPSRSNRLHNHWNHAHGVRPQLLACSRWPAASSPDAALAPELRPFMNRLQEPDSEKPEGNTTALVALADCPDDRPHLGAILKAIFDSPLPVVLLWRGDGADRLLRWTRAGELLARALPALPEVAFGTESADGAALHALDLAPHPWCSLEAALRRTHLLGAKKLWVDHALLVVDCPQRWPARLSTNPRAAPLRLRRN